MAESIKSKMAWRKASNCEDIQHQPIVSLVEIMEEQGKNEVNFYYFFIPFCKELSGQFDFDDAVDADCSYDYFLALELSRDPDCSSDELLAKKLQREFDRELELSQVYF